jgi:hypothetical protein
MILQTIVLILVSLVTCGVSAQSEPASTEPSEARVHFDRGVELYREGSLDAALAEFERSNELAPNYKILYNLAQVQAERHEYVAAIKLLTDYLRQGGNEIPPERRQSAGEDIRKLRQRTSELRVDVSVPGAEVFVNDVSVGRSPLLEPVLVNVGTCRVRAEKTGYVTKRQTIPVAGAEQLRVELTLTAVPQQSARQTTITTRDMTPFWISLGAVVVLGGTTGVAGALALGANHDLDQELNRFPARRDGIDSARHKVRTMAALTDGFGAATIVAAGTAIYFLIAPPQHTEVVRTGGVQARISAGPTGLALSGTF